MSASVAGAFFQTLVWTPRISTSSISNIWPGAVSWASASATDILLISAPPIHSYYQEVLQSAEVLPCLGRGQPQRLHLDGIHYLALVPVMLGRPPEQRPAPL